MHQEAFIGSKKKDVDLEKNIADFGEKRKGAIYRQVSVQD